jgi:hypothetical protein
MRKIAALHAQLALLDHGKPTDGERPDVRRETLLGEIATLTQALMAQ